MVLNSIFFRGDRPIVKINPAVGSNIKVSVENTPSFFLILTARRKTANLCKKNFKEKITKQMKQNWKY